MRDENRVIDLFDLGRTVWRQRVAAAAMLAAVLVATAVYVVIQKPVYQSTETLQLSGTDSSFLGQLNSLTPLYSELITAQQTRNLAQGELGATPLATITVRTFTDSPVLKVDANGGSANAARDSAAAVVQGLSQRLSGKSKLGVSGITVAIIDGPSQPEVTWPRPALTLGVAAIVGIMLGVFTALLIARLRPRQAIPVMVPTPAPASRSKRVPDTTAKTAAPKGESHLAERPTGHRPSRHPPTFKIEEVGSRTDFLHVGHTPPADERIRRAAAEGDVIP
jgi:capsular polysaccharide biosynthesis protein